MEFSLTINSCIDALAKAYRSWHGGTAINRRARIWSCPRPTNPASMPSSRWKPVSPSRPSSPWHQLRHHSLAPGWRPGSQDQNTRRSGDKYVGLVMLFSTENGEPLAIFPDGVVQRMRVASSSALAARYLARRDASTLALFGSGWQAGSHLPAMCAVRPITQVKVYSPTKTNREAFASAMAQRVSAEVIPVESAEEAVRGADIIAATTNSLSQVVTHEWVRPGIDLTCVRVPELGDETIRKVDRLVIHAHQHAPQNFIAGFGDEGIHAHDAIDIIRKGPGGARESKVEQPFWLAAPELRDLVTGRAGGRANDQESTCFLNNIGIGLQFAAVGSAVYYEAKAKGIGREILRIGFWKACTRS